MPTAAEAQKKKVFLGLPTYSNSMRRDFCMSLISVLWTDPVTTADFTIGTIGGDGVARARNNLSKEFLGTDCDILLFVDSDIVFDRHHVERIIRFVSAERPIVGGRYPCKQLEHRWIENGLPNEVPDENGLLRVMELGTAFKAYHRSYFERVREAFPEIMYYCDGCQGDVRAWDFFSQGVVNHRWLSEDYYTDYRAAKLGIPVYADTKCEVQHEGSIRYPLHTNMKIADKLPLGTLVEMAAMLGSPGHSISGDGLSIIRRVANMAA